ncbi:nucleoside triphosphate pyrophosphohydrolase [Marinomonas sp. PE14-40]|uniref:nucleoside triphosphate pyrophosphohydrolase n=1 Tax=Marinomonas sp. PE14-40 TaxID=3060621 RepID=UPI003F671193
MSHNLDDLLTLMANLRTPEKGCPWDLKQTHDSLIPYLTEETYEVLDAIESKDLSHLKEELGDLLFQIVFHAQIANEHDAFNFDDVVSGITSKMLRRHPHVFPDGNLSSFGAQSDLTDAEIAEQWQLIKQQEKALKPQDTKTGLLDSIPAKMPPMQRAVKLQKKAAKVGFDWPDVKPVFAKIREELDELEEAIEEQDNGHIQEELGDLLFVMANLARHVKQDPEQAVSLTNQKFCRRFARIENLLQEQGKKLDDCGLAELDKYWDQAKSEGL